MGILVGSTGLRKPCLYQLICTCVHKQATEMGRKSEKLLTRLVTRLGRQCQLVEICCLERSMNLLMLDVGQPVTLDLMHVIRYLHSRQCRLEQPGRYETAGI